MRGALAEYERAKIIERTKRGCSAVQGRAMCPVRNVPPGYRYVGEPHRGRLEIEEAEATVVRRIFESAWRGCRRG